MMNEDIYTSLDKKAIFIDLRNKNIEDISSLSDFTNVRTLVLDSNKIQDISIIKNLVHLQSLYLENNEIESIDYHTLSSLKKLRRLDLRNNKLKALPKILLDLNMEIYWEDDNNQGITLEGNPMDIPIEIIQKGKKNIRIDISSRKEFIEEAKVLLVGDGSSGKTSLLNRVLTDTYNGQEKQTNGITIKSKIFNTENENIRLNFWDFGGQEKFYTTHNFFFSKRSLYLLLVDSRKESKVEYWLEYIKSIADHSPVIIVMNKIDQNPDFDLNRKDLLENYKNIKGFYKISCKEGIGLDELKKIILQITIKELKLSQIKAPKNWFEIREELKELSNIKDTISYDNFQDICEKYQVDEEKSQEVLLNIYNDLGNITTYRHDNRQQIVLNPNWLVEALYKIISYKNIKNGKFSYIDLDDILKSDSSSNFHYPRRKYNFIINTMKYFNLCFEVENQNYILPDLLSNNSGGSVIDLEKTLNKKDKYSLKIIFKYEILLSEIINKFIIANHQKIKNNMLWRTGTVVENIDESAIALVESKPNMNMLSLQVWKEGKHDFFTFLIENIKELSQDLKYKILIPLEKDSSGKMCYVSYQELKGHWEANRLEYFNGELGRSFNINTLLLGMEKLVDSHIHINKENKQKLSYVERQDIVNYNKDFLENIEEATKYEEKQSYQDAKEIYNNILNEKKYHIKALEGYIRVLKNENKNFGRLEERLNLANMVVTFEENINSDIRIKKLIIENVDFFTNQICPFTDQMNIILGENGYGKTYLLKLVVSLIQNDETILDNYLDNKDTLLQCIVKKDNEYEHIRRSRSFENNKNIGKIAILSIPDVRYLDKSKDTLEDRNDDKSSLREYGSYHFLYNEPYEALIETFLFNLGIKLIDSNDDSLLKKFIEKIFYRLNENEFEIVSAQKSPGFNSKIEIKVKTEGNEKELPIQKASQGTLSIIALFGLIYSYLQDLYPDIEENKITNQNAIIVIDEIDAHLHPSWQRKIINLLKDNFPNIQFFVTAHSPLIVAGCYENEVNVLRKKKDGYELENINEHFLIKKNSELLDDIFEVNNNSENYLYYKYIEKYFKEDCTENEKYYIEQLKGLK